MKEWVTKIATSPNGIFTSGQQTILLSGFIIQVFPAQLPAHYISMSDSSLSEMSAYLDLRGSCKVSGLGGAVGP